MSDLIMTVGWRRWISDHVPTSDEKTKVGTIELYDEFIDVSTSSLYLCVDATEGNLKWQRIMGLKAIGDTILIAGESVISYPEITSNDSITLSSISSSGIPGALYAKSITPGIGFTIVSTSALDTSTVQWGIQ